MQLSLIEESSLLWIVLAAGWGTGAFIYIVQKYGLEVYFNKVKVRKQEREALVWPGNVMIVYLISIETIFISFEKQY